jgi:hypothetical protein
MPAVPCEAGFLAKQSRHNEFTTAPKRASPSLSSSFWAFLDARIYDAAFGSDSDVADGQYWSSNNSVYYSLL